MGDQFLDIIRQIIEDNIGDESFSVSILAKEVGLSRSALHRRLIRLTGKSATALITEIRLNRAVELLESNVATVSEIAYKVGFSSPSYFNKVFKKTFNVSPGDVRKNALDKSANPAVLKNTGMANPVKSKKIKWKRAAWISFLVIFVLIILNIIPRLERNEGLEVMERTIAVLPFHNDSPDQDNEYFISGTMVTIVDKLCKIRDLNVKSRFAVEQFRDTVVPIPEMARILNVNYLLGGSMQEYGDYIRMTLQLYDKKGKLLWSEQFDREITATKDYCNLQSDIAIRVATELHVTITPEEKELIERTHTTSLMALSFYRKAREEHARFWFYDSNLEALKKATALYKSTLREDPAFGKAYAGLAMAIKDSFWADSWNNREFSESETQLYRDSVLRLADKALYYDTNLEEAHLVRGLYFNGIKQYDRALQEYNKALRINPNYSLAYNAKSNLMFYGKSDWIACLDNKLKAVNLEGGVIQLYLLRELGLFYEHMGFSDKAAQIYEEIYRLTADTVNYYMSMGGCAFDTRNWTERIYWFRKALEIDPESNRSLNALCETYNLLGKRDSALHYAFLLQEKSKTTYHFAYTEIPVGTALLNSGHNEEASLVLNNLRDYLVSMHESDEGRLSHSYSLTLAEIYSLKDQPEKALEYLNEIDRRSLQPLWYIIAIETFQCHENSPVSKKIQLILQDLKSNWKREHDKVRLWMEEKELNNPQIASNWK